MISKRSLCLCSRYKTLKSLSYPNNGINNDRQLKDQHNLWDTKNRASTGKHERLEKEVDTCYNIGNFNKLISGYLLSFRP